jgi:RNA polymerase sigma-B factor
MLVLRRMAGLPAGDPLRERLRDEVVEDHMPYARHIARRFNRRNGQADDFAQVAYLGLVRAVDNFDPEHGTAFLGYATAMIIGEIKRYFRDATWEVHVPRRMQELTSALHRSSDALAAQLGRPPTISELADDLDCGRDEVVEALDASVAYRTASLDRSLGYDGDSASLGETIGKEDPGFERTVDHEVLRGLVTELCERDKRILLLRFFRGMSQQEIGEELGVSQMQVSRLITRIIKELRAGFDAEPTARQLRQTQRRAATRATRPTTANAA